MRKFCSQVVIENFFEPCILFLVSQKPSYGYDIKKKLSDDCLCEVNVGNLYRALARMQKNGFIKKSKVKGSLGPARIEYAITEKGEEYLASWISSLETQQQAISRLITNYKKTL